MSTALERRSPFAGIAEAAAAGVTFDESSLTIVDPDLPYEIYETLLESAGRVKRSMSWWIGDLINFGEGLYPDRYSQAMEATGLKYETISNYAWVCRRVARSRRRDHLSFGIHAEVAKLEPREQTLWLKEAEKNDWTTSALREALRPAPEPTQPAPATQDALTPRAIANAAGAVSTAQATLEKLAAGDMVPAGDIPKAARALEQAGETLRVAAAVPTLHEVASRVVDESIPNGNGTSAVPTATLDELRVLVAKEATE